MNARTDPIGIFDSGLGGISTLREMRKLLPGEHFIYYGDTGNAPYGTKTREEVLQFIGMEPALKPAHEIRKSGKILVLATPLTLREEKFSRLMSRFGEGAEKVPCEGLVELVEAEDRDGAKRYLETLLAGFRLDEVDAVVLGCTHYVFLRNMIKNMIPDHIAITDGNAGTARQLRRVLAERELLNDAGEGSVRILTSGTDTDLQKMNRLLQNADT